MLLIARMRVLGSFALSLVASLPSFAADVCRDPQACYWTTMPLFSQLDPTIGSHWLPDGPAKSQLCGPTAGAMALQAVINAASPGNLKSETWTANFSAQTPPQKIASASELMQTWPKSGTIFIPTIFGANIVSTSIGAGRMIPGKRSEFQSADGTVSGWGPHVSNSTYISRLRASRKRADIMAYGHYKRHQSSILGVRIVTFSREGGHFVAVNGHYGKDWLHIYDPWGGVREWQNIGSLEGGLKWRKGWLGIPFPDELTVLPNISSRASYLYKTDIQVKFIDGDMGIWAD